MPATVTVTLSGAEHQELLRRLVALREAHAEIGALMPSIGQILLKLAQAQRGLNITVGVHGGQVQWVLGNPFPVRVCDYDGDRSELPDLDERHQKCRIWFEPVDNEWAVARWKQGPKAAGSF